MVKLTDCCIQDGKINHEIVGPTCIIVWLIVMSIIIYAAHEQQIKPNDCNEISKYIVTDKKSNNELITTIQSEIRKDISTDKIPDSKLVSSTIINTDPIIESDLVNVSKIPESQEQISDCTPEVNKNVDIEEKLNDEEISQNLFGYILLYILLSFAFSLVTVPIMCAITDFKPKYISAFIYITTCLITFWIFLAYAIYRKYKSTEKESIKMASVRPYIITKNGNSYELAKNCVVLCTLNNSILQKDLFFELGCIKIGEISVVVYDNGEDIEFRYKDRKVKPVFPMTMNKLVEYFVELYKPELEQNIKELKILTKISGLNEISNEDVLAYLEQ